MIGLAGGLVWLMIKYWRFYAQFRILNDQSQIQQLENEHLQIYKTVVQNSPDLFVIVDQSLQVIVANKTATFFGWKNSLGFSDADISLTSKLHFEVEIRKVIKTGLISNGEIRMSIPKEETFKFFRYHIFPVRIDGKVIVGATITAQDVTAQREAENEMIRQREFAEGIMNAIPDAIYVKDDHEKFIYGNKLFTEMLGRKSMNYTGFNDHEVFPRKIAESFKKSDRNVLRTDIALEVEEEIANFEGKTWTVLSKRIPFNFQNGQKVLIAIMRDFSERKKLESELQVSRIRQEEAARLATLGETASGIAHEINNPLNVLVGIAELMKDKVEKGGAIEKNKLNEYCDKIVTYSLRIAKIIKGLQSISRDASEDPFTEISIAHLIDETLELCRQQFLHRGIQIEFKVPNQAILIEGRYAQLSQILMNLLNNAKDAVENQKIPTIFIEILKEEEFGVIRVWDNGDGVSEEIESKIMNPFFTTKPVGKGTGLGLSISHSIASDHKGSLTLNREVAASCFELKIPLLFELQLKKIA